MTRHLLVAFAATALLACGGTKAQPTQEQLGKQLTELAASLEKGDLDAAIGHMMLPPGRSIDEMRPMLPALVEKREISSAGVAELMAKGKFGKLAEVFPEAGAKRAGRMGINVEECYGWSLGDAEVMARWTGSEFKIFRLDDVGKLTGDAAPDQAPTE